MIFENPAHLAYREYLSRTSVLERLDCLFLAFEFLARVDALLFAASFLRTETWKDEKIRNLLFRRKFSLGDWLALLEALIGTAQPGSPAGLAKWYLNRKKTPKLRIFDEVVKWRNLRAHSERRNSPDFLQQALASIEEPFVMSVSEHPDLGEFTLGGEDNLVYVGAFEPIDCGPLMIPGLTLGGTSEILLYKGYSANKLCYGSISGREYWNGEKYRELTDFLRGKISPLEAVSLEHPLEILSARMRVHARQTIERLTESRCYRPDITVDRIEADTLFDAFMEGDQALLLLDGPSGSGKTTWMCRVAEKSLMSGRTVFFDTTERLPDSNLPEAVCLPLRFQGEIATAFERLSTTSQDGKVLMLFDDVGTRGKEDKFLISLANWVDQLSLASAVRIVATIRTDRLQAFLRKYSETLIHKRIKRFQLPPLSVAEINILCERLPVPIDRKEEVLLSRKEVARKLSSLTDTSIKRPALVVALLESLSDISLTPTFSTFRVYEEIYRRNILGLSEEGVPKTPLRGRILRNLAKLILSRSRLDIELDDEELRDPTLIDWRTGERNLEYHALISDGVLAETFENYLSLVSFVDVRFFEFISSLSLSIEQYGEHLRALIRDMPRFASSPSIAAFLTARALAKTETSSVWKELQQLGEEKGTVLVELAGVDSVKFLSLFELACKHEPQEAEHLLETIMLHTGEASVAARAAGILIRMAEGDEARICKARYVRAKALYEGDEFNEAEKELDLISGENVPLEVLSLRAVILTSRGDYEKAHNTYRELLRFCPSTEGELRGDALAGLGYTLGRMGRKHEAIETLRQAIVVLEQWGNTKSLAEAYADLGEVLIELDRLSDARSPLTKSLEVNKKNGFLMGIAIVQGLFGWLEVREGRLDTAETFFEQSLHVSRRMGNRWREAWILEKKSMLLGIRGKEAEATACFEEAKRLRDEISFRRS